MSDKLKSRLQNEREHALYLLSKDAESVWGRADYFVQYGMLGQGIKALEVGCGAGMFTRELVKSGEQLTAIDISPDLLVYARNNIKSSNVIFEEQDAMNTTFDDNSFDVVLGCSVLHHLEADVALKEFYAGS